MIYPRQIKAARALVGLSQVELAARVDVSVATIKRIEASADVLRFKVETMLRLREALEAAGIVFVSADENGGLGVRLKDPDVR